MKMQVELIQEKVAGISGVRDTRNLVGGLA
jgi:hypothetical protein